MNDFDEPPQQHQITTLSRSLSTNLSDPGDGGDHTHGLGVLDAVGVLGEVPNLGLDQYLLDHTVDTFLMSNLPDQPTEGSAVDVAAAAIETTTTTNPNSETQRTDWCLLVAGGRGEELSKMSG